MNKYSKKKKMIDSVPYRFPTAEERWPRQGEVASITKPYEFPKLVIEEHEDFIKGVMTY